MTQRALQVRRTGGDDRQLKSTIAEQMEAVTARLKEHHAQIQKVGAQIELQKPPAQTVIKNR